MSLLYPNFLWALGLNIIPILIHLFNLQRHETIYFSDITLIKNIEKETKRVSKLKNILVLLLRMSLITSLVIAFCFPYNKENSIYKINSSGVIGIYLDNSFSMQRTNSNQTLLENAKDDVISLLDQFSETTKFVLTTNQKNKNKSYTLNKSDLIKELTLLKYTSNSLNYNEIIAIQNEQCKQELSHSYWFTDLHKKDFDFKKVETDSVFKINIIHYSSKNVSNISIDSVWFSEKSRKLNTEDELNIKITNYSENEIEFQTKLFINKNEVITQSLNVIKPNEIKNISFHYILENKGIKNGVIEITDASYNDQTFDDTYYFTYEVNQNYKVLHLYENDNNIQKSFETLYAKIEKSQFKSINISNGFTKEELEADLIILDGILTFKKELISGLTSSKNRNIVFIPNENCKYLSYEILEKFKLKLIKCDTTVKNINQKIVNETFFNSVFNKKEKNINLPYFNKTFQLSPNVSISKTPLIYLSDNKPLLIQSEEDENQLFLFTTPLNTGNSNLTNHALFVPIFLKIKETCANDKLKQYKINRIPLIYTENKQQNGQITVVDQISNPNFSFYPSISYNQGKTYLNCENQIENDGHYFLKLKDSTIDSFSVNYNRDESNMLFLSSEEIQTRIKNSNLDKHIKYLENNIENKQSIFSKKQNQEHYWKYFIILGIIFIALEITVIKLTEKNVL